MCNLKKTVIFVDTSFLKSVSWMQDSDWQRLLKIAQERKIAIHISKVAFGEYCSYKQDVIIDEISRVKSTINDFINKWKKSIITQGIDLPPLAVDNLPEDKLIQENADKIVKEQLSQFIIEPISKDDADNVFDKYFAWKAPFHNGIGNRLDGNSRKNRKEQIPDAFIIEVALNLKKQSHAVLCLTKDGNMQETLRRHDLKFFESAADIINILESSAASKAPVLLNLDNTLKQKNEDQDELKIKILGYVKSFDSISKEDLSNLLTQKGYPIDRIENITQSLVLDGFLKDTGHHLLPVQDEICNEAKNRIIPEILELIDE